MITDTYLIMSFFNGAQQVGLSEYDENNYHVTLIDQVRTNERDIMLTMFENAAATHSPFAMTIGNVAHFGSYGQYKVLSLHDSPNHDAKRLHNDLLDEVTAHDIHLINPNYGGQGYHPHITVMETQYGFRTGDTVNIEHMTLVRHEGGFGFGEVEVVANALLGT